MTSRSKTRSRVRPVLLASLLAMLPACAQTTSRTPVSETPPAAGSPPAAETRPSIRPGGGSDPRVGLSAGVHDAEMVAWNMELLANVPKPEGFVGPGGLADLLFANSDLAFQGNYVFVGSFRGFNVYDISDPANPTLEVSVLCPGGQGDLSVHGDLLFMSVEMPNGRTDCQDGAMDTLPSAERFRGVRIWDISDLRNPEQVAYVQTCRGSHTHTLELSSSASRVVPTMRWPSGLKSMGLARAPDSRMGGRS